MTERVFYPVVGSTIPILMAVSKALGPRRGGVAHAAFTDWEVRWKYACEVGPVGRAVDAGPAMLALRGRLAQVLREVIDPGSAPLGPVRVAIMDHVIQLDQRVEAARSAIGGQPRLDGDAVLPASGPFDDAHRIQGGGRGGGGAKVSDWSNQDHRHKTSVLTIAGGGIIDSPNGLTLAGDGGSIRMEGGTMTLRAAKIVLQAEAIEIASSGEATVVGHPLHLNK